MAYSCCLSLGANLDFPDFLQKRFHNIIHYSSNDNIVQKSNSYYYRTTISCREEGCEREAREANQQVWTVPKIFRGFDFFRSRSSKRLNLAAAAEPVSLSLLSESREQCDQIWQMFATLAKFSKCCPICLGFIYYLAKYSKSWPFCIGFIYYLAKFWTYLGKFCMPLGKFSLMKMANCWEII